MTTEIGRRAYSMRVWTGADYFAMDAEIVARRGDPFGGVQASYAAAAEDERPKILADAFESLRTRTIVTSRDRLEFAMTLDGIAWSLWRSLYRDHPEVDSLDAAKAIVVELGPARLPELMGMISQVRPLIL